ncbi:hypothetical protein M222_0726 [Enterococcus faecalis AZ19]|nr:hypothetical protein M222_0726 [Enterococcus faecalis AZ19]
MKILAVFWRKVGGFCTELGVIMVVSKDKGKRGNACVPS